MALSILSRCQATGSPIITAAIFDNERLQFAILAARPRHHVAQAGGIGLSCLVSQLLHWDLCSSPLDMEQREGRIQRFGGLSVRTALAATLNTHSLGSNGQASSPWLTLAQHAADKFKDDPSVRSPWWSCPGEKIDRLFVVLPQSRQEARFDQLSRQRWLYRLALGQPHQEDFIEAVSQLPEDGRHKYALCLSAWKNGST